MRVNNQIRAPIVRVISSEGENLGDLPIAEALQHARAAGLDLIEIAPNTTPPITKITEYGKYKYIQEKKTREQHKKQKEIEFKSVRISLNIGAHDKEIKANAVKEFLAEGNKVVVEIFLRGREKANRAFAEKKFKEFLAVFEDDVVYEQRIKPGPRGFSVVIGKKSSKT
ncbi:MAG: translation initiation factor IF-3 [Patescibacteria group bacterium]